MVMKGEYQHLLGGGSVPYPGGIRSASGHGPALQIYKVVLLGETSEQVPGVFPWYLRQAPVSLQ